LTTPITLPATATNGQSVQVAAVGDLTLHDDPLVAVVSILDDKDAAGMLARLMPICDALVFTSSQNPRALPPPTLQSLARQLHGPGRQTPPLQGDDVGTHRLSPA